MSGTTQVSRYQKGKTRKVKTNLDLLEQEIVSGSGICWGLCKSAPHPRQPCQHSTTQYAYLICDLPLEMMCRCLCMQEHCTLRELMATTCHPLTGLYCRSVYSLLIDFAETVKFSLTGWYIQCPVIMLITWKHELFYWHTYTTSSAFHDCLILTFDLLTLGQRALALGYWKSHSC